MLLYWLWAEKNITPGQYYDMPVGEKIIIRAFVNKMLEDRQRR